MRKLGIYILYKKAMFKFYENGVALETISSTKTETAVGRNITEKMSLRLCSFLANQLSSWASQSLDLLKTRPKNFFYLLSEIIVADKTYFTKLGFTLQICSSMSFYEAESLSGKESATLVTKSRPNLLLLHFHLWVKIFMNRPQSPNRLTHRTHHHIWNHQICKPFHC